MKKYNLLTKILFFVFTVVILIAAYELLAPKKYTLIYKINKHIVKSNIEDTKEKNLLYGSRSNEDVAPKTVEFAREGIDNIALITMIKDEDDIIYENLVWHFCVGFRKFVIVDNNSTDNTRLLVEKFKRQVLGKAIVVVIDDPIIEYIQSQVTTGAMLLANSLWPKLDWVFPVDADEFWYPNVKLQSILDKTPSKSDVILTMQYQHVPIETVDHLNGAEHFYKNIKFRIKSLSGGLGKVAVRPGIDVIIAQGNHSASSKTRNLNYFGGNILGLDMRHFQMRSTAQTEKKYWNGAKANILAQKLGIISEGVGHHWTAFKEEVDRKGIKQSAIDRFNNSFQPKESCIEDPLPMEQAFKLFKELTDG